jgi:hypothetical protein
VNAHPDANIARCEPALSLGRRGQRVTGACEDNEEGVALRVDLRPAMLVEGGPEQPAMLRERLLLAFGAELLQELRRALDVGEEERHRSGREVPH